MEIVFDLVILFDIFLSFITDNYSSPGETLSNWQIASQYMLSTFVYDLLSTVGILWGESVAPGGGQNWRYCFKLIRYVYLFRTLDFVDTLLHNLLNSGKKHFIKNSIFLIK
jgi:hypothetical protein